METLTPTQVEGIALAGPLTEAYERLLSPTALVFLRDLHRRFNPRREHLLHQRVLRQRELDAGQWPEFLRQTEIVRTSNWQVSPIPADLQDRRTEITGPVDRKMIINALNSGAKVFMADFEDATSPTWTNVMDGQVNLYDAIRRRVDFTAENGKRYALGETPGVLKVRPRGWHLTEKHVLVDGEPMSASLFDFGLYFFHNAQELLDRDSGPYFYLPKLESHLEARLWNEVFIAAQQSLYLPEGTIKVTVLIETILAAFEMEEIIYELRHHMAGLNAGRWDYIFSVIKKFRKHPTQILPDRGQITMTVPFMQAYAQQLVKVCHRRGAHAIGGMAAFIPSRKDEEVNKRAFEKVKADKQLEANNGFDGTWVAHPDLVAVAKEQFNAVLGDRPHQKEVMREDVKVKAADLLNFRIPHGEITETGARLNINVGILYLAAWLSGTGAAAIYNLMEDAATAEISRAQIWQWLHHDRVQLEDGRKFTLALYRSLFESELEKIAQMVGPETFEEGPYRKAAEIFDALVTQETFEEFLTLPAYKELD